MESSERAEKFATLDFNHWPLAIVRFNELQSNEDFDFFLKRWENLSKANQDYSIILDTRKISNIGLQNAFSGMSFIKRLRNQNPQRLKNTILIYNNNYMYYLFNFVLTFQSPVSKTYSYFTEDLSDLNYLELFNQRNSDPEKFKVFE
mgnify:CR=1 FL=1|tara:strand:+ start:1793 stop:2233 length:441 start_codon:yes stop_codon:yes gene_type:complete